MSQSPDIHTAVRTMEDAILAAWPGGAPAEADVDVYLWGASLEGVGIRVAEISHTCTDGARLYGSSVMQVDEECYALVFEAERALIYMVHPEYNFYPGTDQAELDAYADEVLAAFVANYWKNG